MPTSGAPWEPLHVFDASSAPVIDDAAVDAFRRDGFLVLRHVLAPAELHLLQRETAALIDRARERGGWDPDYAYGAAGASSSEVLARIEYVVDKVHSAKALLGHPFLLGTVEALQGPNFIPTWDSMVLKAPGAGAPVAWHRDDGAGPGAVSHLRGARVFNVDVYLDPADARSCVWGIPGSNHWDVERVAQEALRRNTDGFGTETAVPIPMEAGDVLLHDVMALHGSQATSGPLRRVIYFEFRPVDLELAHGPHVPAYVPLKQQVLAAAVRRRRAMPYAEGEQPFESQFAPDHEPATWRYPHHDYWRKENCT